MGGAKTQRNKWLKLFFDANAVIFIAAMNGYCQPLDEDPNIMKLQDSLSLFGSLVNNQYLNQVSIILFLNKRDIFKKVIKHVPLTVCFPSFADHVTTAYSPSSMTGKFIPLPIASTSANSIDSSTTSKDIKVAAEFIRDRFLEENKNSSRDIKCHVTCATDKTQLSKIIDDISKFWLKSAFDKFGLI